MNCVASRLGICMFNKMDLSSRPADSWIQFAIRSARKRGYGLTDWLIELSITINVHCKSINYIDINREKTKHNENQNSLNKNVTRGQQQRGEDKQQRY